MVNENIIKENYARMTDEQLLHLAKFDAQGLTSNALLLLREAFQHRHLDISILNNNNGLALQDAGLIKDGTSYKISDSIWAFVFTEKEAGKTNEEIYDGLIARAINESDAQLILASLKSKATEILNKQHASISKGLFIGVAGLAVAVWKYSPSYNNNLYYAGLTAIIIGVFFLFRGVSSKSRYKTILVNIETERIIAEQAAIEETPPDANNQTGWVTTKSG